ncbi:MAG TPA: hypothetical protein VGJ86_12175 [Acidimicrobiales bacterium]|jgi:hypothetical protein
MTWEAWVAVAVVGAISGPVQWVVVVVVAVTVGGAGVMAYLRSPTELRLRGPAGVVFGPVAPRCRHGWDITETGLDCPLCNPDDNQPPP